MILSIFLKNITLILILELYDYAIIPINCLILYDDIVCYKWNKNTRFSFKNVIV